MGGSLKKRKKNGEKNCKKEKKNLMEKKDPKKLYFHRGKKEKKTRGECF